MATSDFQLALEGYSLTTAEILYRLPDHQSLLQTFVWQNYDLHPRFPRLHDFLSFWESHLEGPPLQSNRLPPRINIASRSSPC